MWGLGESLWPGEAGSSLCSERKKERQAKAKSRFLALLGMEVRRADKGEKQFLALLGTEERRTKTRTSS